MSTQQHFSLLLIVLLISGGLFMFTYKSTQFNGTGFILVSSLICAINMQHRLLFWYFLVKYLIGGTRITNVVLLLCYPIYYRMLSLCPGTDCFSTFWHEMDIGTSVDPKRISRWVHQMRCLHLTIYYMFKGCIGWFYEAHFSSRSAQPNWHTIPPPAIHGIGSHPTGIFRWRWVLSSFINAIYLL